MAKENYKGIWVFAEQHNGELADVSLEMIAQAKKLQAITGEDVTAVLLGDNVASLTDKLFAYGADKVILAEHKNLANYSARPYQKVLTELAEKHKPSILLYGATSLGRDLAPRLMISLRTGLTADAIELSFDEDGVFCQTTPNYGGSILAHIVILEHRPQMVTVRPKLFAPLEPVEGAKGELIVENIEVEADDSYVVISTSPKITAGKPIDEASLLVAGGRGIKSEADLKSLEELAELLGGQLAVSRPLVDCGWRHHDGQIGQSGTAVKPSHIINVGISGSVQYLVGMQDSECVISINHTNGAPIFDVSHYGAIADYSTLIPAITAEIKKRRA